MRLLAHADGRLADAQVRPSRRPTAVMYGGTAVTRAEVERAMTGDHDAFAALVGPANDRLYAVAHLILRDADRAKDATQEALVKAWRELPRLRDPDRFDAWLRRLLVNACYDEARRIRRRSEVTYIASMDLRSEDATRDVVERERVERAFRRLPVDQRTVLVLQHHARLTQAEIAETLGIPLGTAKSRIRYASESMRASLEADDRLDTLAPIERTA